jgi:hypothetical protein
VWISNIIIAFGKPLGVVLSFSSAWSILHTYHITLLNSLWKFIHTLTSLISMISSFLGVYDMYSIADSGRAILWQLIMFMKHHKLRNLWYNCDGVLYFSLEKDYQSNGERRSHMIHAIVRPYKGRVWIGHIVQGLVHVVHYNISGWIYHLWNHQQLAIQGRYIWVNCIGHQYLSVELHDLLGW